MSGNHISWTNLSSNSQVSSFEDCDPIDSCFNKEPLLVNPQFIPRDNYSNWNSTLKNNADLNRDSNFLGSFPELPRASSTSFAKLPKRLNAKPYFPLSPDYSDSSVQKHMMATSSDDTAISTTTASLIDRENHNQLFISNSNKWSMCKPSGKDKRKNDNEAAPYRNTTNQQITTKAPNRTFVSPSKTKGPSNLPALRNPRVLSGLTDEDSTIISINLKDTTSSNDQSKTLTEDSPNSQARRNSSNSKCRIHRARTTSKSHHDDHSCICHSHCSESTVVTSPISVKAHVCHGSTPSNCCHHTGAHCHQSDDSQRVTYTPDSAINFHPELIEIDLIHELLYAMQGISGNVIEFCTCEKRFIVHRCVGVPINLRNITERIAECGALYMKVRDFIDCRKCACDYGPINQAMCAALHSNLNEYLRLIASVESQLLPCDHVMIGPHLVKPPDLNNPTLKHLSLWSMEPHSMLKSIVLMIEALEYKRGGQLLSVVYSFLNDGHNKVNDAVRVILSEMIKPFYLALVKWMFEGELEQNEEFFVLMNPHVKMADRFWYEKCVLKEPFIPKFMSMKQAIKTLVTGKSVNFLRFVCDHNVAALRCKETIKRAIIDNIDAIVNHEVDLSFDKMIHTIYRETSHYLLQVLFDKFQFMDHLNAIRRYLLLGQGDFIHYLMILLEEDLDNSADSLMLHNLVGVLETAIRGTTANNEQLNIRQRLDVRLLEKSQGDVGWDVFSLDYHVDGPLRTIFTTEVMHKYLQIFNFLWRVRRVEHVLGSLLRNQIGINRLYNRIKDVNRTGHTACLLNSEMTHFVKQLQYYINFEVLECSFNQLFTRISKVEDLDQLIQAHNNFLSQILTRCFLKDFGEDSFLNKLMRIFDLIIESRDVQEEIYKSVDEELEHRSLYDPKLSGYSPMNKKANKSDEADSAKDSSTLEGKLVKIRTNYREKVTNLLEELFTQREENLCFLGKRINFNYFYIPEENEQTTEENDLFFDPDNDKDSKICTISGLFGDAEQCSLYTNPHLLLKSNQPTSFNKANNNTFPIGEVAVSEKSSSRSSRNESSSHMPHVFSYGEPSDHSLPQSHNQSHNMPSSASHSYLSNQIHPVKTLGNTGTNDKSSRETDRFSMSLGFSTTPIQEKSEKEFVSEEPLYMKFLNKKHHQEESHSPRVSSTKPTDAESLYRKYLNRKRNQAVEPSASVEGSADGNVDSREGNLPLYLQYLNRKREEAVIEAVTPNRGVRVNQEHVDGESSEEESSHTSLYQKYLYRKNLQE